MKRMLLAVDGTHSGITARTFGLKWARLQGAEVTGLAVLDVDAMTGAEAVPLGASSYKAHRDEQHVQADRKYLDAQLKAFTTSAAALGVKSSEILASGEPVQAIVAEADTHDVIVIGRTTTFDLGKESPSLDIVTNLLGAAPRPVIVTPDADRADGDVLVAFDGSVSSVRALQLFSLLGDAWRRNRVVVLTVHDAADAAARLAQRATRYLAAHGYAATARPVTSAREPANVILEEAGEMPAGLIVQGAFGNRSWLDFLLGSTTTAMLKDAKIPLFMSH